MFARLLHRLTHLMAHEPPVPSTAEVGPSVAVPAHPMHTASVSSKSRWTPDRICVIDALWGEGFGFPAGEEETIRFAKPLVLSNASSLLLIDVGAGGPACSVANTLGAWVSGFEADPTLATLVAERRARSGLGKRVEIKTWGPREPGFACHSYHHAMAREALRGAQVGAVLVSIFRALSPGGQLVMVDLVADPPLDPGESAVAAWCALDNRPPTIPSERSITAALGPWVSMCAWPRTSRCGTCSRHCGAGIGCDAAWRRTSRRPPPRGRSCRRRNCGCVG